MDGRFDFFLQRNAPLWFFFFLVKWEDVMFIRLLPSSRRRAATPCAFVTPFSFGYSCFLPLDTEMKFLILPWDYDSSSP